ncbi:5-methyltetrahydropteroyltriglutamate--homocysteine methyltransferase [Archaeoglobales archaeon]|nr:MAG: 5-methyltetrahydropteroyltriglutamate--homocysteine methyltransferase [Archaeoglobales archaeon]
MLFDDIGSFPLPEGITRDWIFKNLDTREYEEMVQRAFLMKVNSGVECPNYPQFQDMIEQFMTIIKNPEYQDEAYLVSKKHAIIKELEAVEKIECNSVRVCVTGPFELYYKELGGVIYDDILSNLATSISRFVENAVRYNNVKCVSIDEPSLGLSPELQPTQEQIKLAFEKFKFDVDIQIHLHSPLFYTNLLEINEIDVIGIETAKDRRAMDLVDLNDLEIHDKKIRIGVARSDIDGIVAEFNAKYNVNAWKDKKLIAKAIEEMEDVKTIKNRIIEAYNKFADRIAYIGPDCGLFSFPSQETATILLKNTRKAIDEFREGR